MRQNTEIMDAVLEKCDIMLNDQVISKELLIQTFASFISQTVGKRKHNVGLVMHTGSICFDVLAVTYAAIVNLISNETRSGEIIESIHIGDVVLYGEKKKERYVYDGKTDGGCLSKDCIGIPYIKLHQGNGKISYVAKKRWHLIEPYNGNSKRLDGRGIRKKSTNRDEFLVEVLGYQKENVPSVIDTSSVIVMSRDRADMLVKGISLQFGEKKIKLLELVTASYYTEEDEYCYGGNTGKNEPVLKFAGKISVARKLLYSRQGNFHVGLMVLGKESINRGVTELPELVNRKSLQYVYLCTSLDLEFGQEMLQENEEVEVFACTKDFLLENSKTEPEMQNIYTKELFCQIETAIEKENELAIVYDAPLEWEDYILFKKNLLWIKRNDFVSNEKDEFIIHAHSLMNLFSTVIFSIETLVRAKERGIIDIATPQEKLKQLEEWRNSLPGYVKEKADAVLQVLRVTYSKLLLRTGKERWLSEFLIKNEGSKIAIVVPKAYYASVVRAGLVCSHRFIRNLVITTPGRFDDTAAYDFIIAVGDVDGKRFNAFGCNSALKIISLLYPFETRVYNYKKRNAEKKIYYLQNRSTIKVEMSEEWKDEIDENNEEVLEVNSEIDDYISNLDMYAEVKRFSTNHVSGNYNINAEIVAIAVFTDETRAYFSKNYKGYIFDESTGIVREEGPLNFCEGDSIVFTQNNDETKDIVDSILTYLIQEKKVSEAVVDAYNKSKVWKIELIKYMHKNNLTMKEVANQMIKSGVSVQEATICRWLDEDAHTVGPRSINSIAQIGRLVKNEDLNQNAAIYFEACREIRSVRRKILEQVGQAIIGKLSGKIQNGCAEYVAIYDKVDILAEVLQIERLIYTESSIPMNMANRPIRIQE